MSSVCRFADCIENGHMPGDLHAVMSTAPFKNLNCCHPGSSKSWAKCQRKCKSLGRRDQEHNGPGCCIHGDIPKRFQCNILPGSGDRRISNVVEDRGKKAEKRRLLRTQEPGTKVQSWHIPMTAQWLAFFCRRRQEREKVRAISNCPKGRPKLPTSFMRSSLFY